MIPVNMKIKSIFFHPTFHIISFGFIGALILFIVFGFPKLKSQNYRLVFGDADVAQVRASWIRTWQREPTIQELRAEVKNHIRNEILYREALKRGYDEDDLMIKRTLVRKMDFLATNQVQSENISEDELKSYFVLRREQYRIPAQLSFIHIFFNRDKRGLTIQNDIQNVKSKLLRIGFDKINPTNFGDRFMLQQRYVDLDQRAVSSALGNVFADTVFTLEPNIWHGPISSGYGLHLVYVYESIVPRWTDIKSKLLNDMIIEGKLAAKEQFYTEILRQYQIAYEGMAEMLLSGEKIE